MSDPRVVIAGSRKLPPGEGPRLVVRFLASLPWGSTILLRRGSFTEAGVFEQSVAALCEVIGLDVEWHIPVITQQRAGRRAVWTRDMEMVAQADVVLCFYDVDQIGDEESGTVALVDKAMELDVPVYAYALTLSGESIIRVGEHDPKNLWADKVPAA